MKISIFIICWLLIQTKNDYLFSVIISIYNTARYLEYSICSLLNQTIGYRKIQIILVNDGSTDYSENICLHFQKIFPNNIIYIKINHSGVSQARNIGLNHAKGLYINFLDSDDKWDLHAFSYIHLFFRFYKNVNLVGARIKYFESKNNYHFLDYKFFRTRVVNLTEDYNCIQLSASSSFFRSPSIKGIKFKEGIFSGEDIRYISNNILYNPTIGLIREAIYYYRKRSDSSSAIQNTEGKNDFYITTIYSVQQYIIDKSIVLYNQILPFIQYYIAYETLFRIESKAYKFLDLKNYILYRDVIQNLLYQTDEKFILEQKIFPSRLQIFALSKKYNRDKRNDIIFRNDSFILSNYTLLNLTKYKHILFWRILDIKENRLHLEGEDRCWLPREQYFYFCKIGNKTFYPKYDYYSGYDFITMYGIIYKGRIVIFDLILDIKDEQNLQFFLSYKDNNIEIFTSFDLYIHIPSITNSYYLTSNYIIHYRKNLSIYLYNDILAKFLEQQYCKELKKSKKDYLIKFRQEYMEYKNKSENQQIWLINDRKGEAGDNGEYFFRYLYQLKPKGIKFFFQ